VAQSASTPDITEIWKLRYYSRDVPKAPVTTTVANADRQSQAEKDLHAIRWRNHVGVPSMMDDGSPIDIG